MRYALEVLALDLFVPVVGFVLFRAGLQVAGYSGGPITLGGLAAGPLGKFAGEHLGRNGNGSSVTVAGPVAAAPAGDVTTTERQSLRGRPLQSVAEISGGEMSRWVEDLVVPVAITQGLPRFRRMASGCLTQAPNSSDDVKLADVAFATKTLNDALAPLEDRVATVCHRILRRGGYHQLKQFLEQPDRVSAWLPLRTLLWQRVRRPRSATAGQLPSAPVGPKTPRMSRSVAARSTGKRKPSKNASRKKRRRR